MDNPTNSIAISLISTLGGVIIAYISYKANQRVKSTKKKDEPKDRMEQMFDGYERLIKQKDQEDDRKVKAMQALEEELVFTRATVSRLEASLAATQHELEVSRQENVELRAMLEQMRKEYNEVKKTQQPIKET